MWKKEMRFWQESLIARIKVVPNEQTLNSAQKEGLKVQKLF